ncbi:hypothetical protein HGP28_06195 [Vibrio sp. SM6]|uniref:Haloacid dehalogenase-like hydrolase n=1 Tax=Vibrio agarilyticus TaxID=2726741 RepID=A0A7X8YGF6_9VIBR|nr:hypothetical protein [Vibrio agarilyticus]NLS12490.1 hypothetical protein [Vibrio agarilyticus]
MEGVKTTDECVHTDVVGETQETTHCTSDFELYSKINELSDDEPIIVDFDETLWLRNSTESFLAMVTPSVWVGFWLQLLGMLSPWRWLSPNDPEHTRDWIRVLVVTIVAPWSIGQWRRAASQQATQYINRPLYDALIQSKQPIFVASYGFRFVIQPLLDALSCNWQLAVASDLKNAPKLRQEGKGAAVVRILGEASVNSGLSISDSQLDKDLFAMTRYSALIRWPNAKYEQAGLKPMLPFAYLKKVKRPNESYFTRAILGHDYLVLLLTFTLVSSTPWLSAISLFLFVLSYFTAYEIGYNENDRLGLRYEAHPKVSDAYQKLAKNYVPTFAWVCSALLAVPAAITASYVDGGVSSVFEGGVGGAAVNIWLVFMGLIIAVRIVFAWFNRLTEVGRMVPMLILQLARSVGYLLIFTTTSVGVFFLVSQALSKWIPYLVYRCGGSRERCPNHMINAMLLCCFLFALSMAGDNASIWDDWSTWVILGYSAARAVIELRKFLPHFKLLQPVVQPQTEQQ